MSHALRSYYSYVTPHGLVSILATDTGIARVFFGTVPESDKPQIPRQASSLTNRAATELLEYLAGKRKIFEVPLDLDGSEFQQAVWNAVATIPYGQTSTSMKLAHKLGKPHSFHSVGMALRANPVPLFIPTHRVIGTNGRPLASEILPPLFAGARALETTEPHG